jgi:hypothetical protein
MMLQTRGGEGGGGQYAQETHWSRRFVVVVLTLVVYASAHELPSRGGCKRLNDREISRV